MTTLYDYANPERLSRLCVSRENLFYTLEKENFAPQELQRL